MYAKRLEICRDELDKIRRANDGKLTTEMVVDAARAEDHPLHPYFTWEDSAAAELWRKQEARTLIQTVNVLQEAGTEVIETRAYVSLMADRVDGTGYRWLTDVLATPDLRSQYLAQVLRELNALRSKYAGIKELAKVWEEIDTATANHTPKPAQLTTYIDTVPAPYAQAA